MFLNKSAQLWRGNYCTWTLPSARPFQQLCANRPKIFQVRKRAHLAVSEVLSSLANSPSLPPASDSVDAFSERILTAATTTASPENATSAAANAMHLLGAVRIMLPRMSGKASGKLMQRLAGLVTLQQPIITRLVVDALDAACDADVSTDVSPGALADVIGRVLELSDVEKRSADESAAVVKLAEKGHVKLHKLDPALSAKRLPGAFYALAANLATEREELIFTTAECLRTLINDCIDDAMIQQGISQSEAKAGPSAVERICVCLEGTLGYQYRGSWDMALLVVAEMYQKLGPASYQLLHKTTQTLGK